MKTIFTITGLLLSGIISQASYAQAGFRYKDDFKKILTRTKDPEDRLYYDRLLKRFSVNDTTLKDFDVLALMIGFTGKAEYKPYYDLSREQGIYNLNAEGKYREALDSAGLFLRSHPLSVKVLFEKSYAFYKLGEQDSAAVYGYKGARIFKAMHFSGDGRSGATPVFALGPADGQDYIRKYVNAKIQAAGIGSMGSGRDKNGDFLDILEVVPKDGSDPYNLYFIIQHATDKMFSKEDLNIPEEKGQGK